MPKPSINVRTLIVHLEDIDANLGEIWGLLQNYDILDALERERKHLHRIRERTLTERIDEEHCACSSNRCAVSNADPRTHTQAVGEFPLTSHIGIDADEEVEYNKLERTTVVEPLIQGSSFPDGVKVQSNSIGRRNNSTRDDVVSVHQRTSNRFTDAINVHWGSTDECDNEASSCSKQAGDHQNAEPTHIEAVVGAGDPAAELFPSIRFLLT